MADTTTPVLGLTKPAFDGPADIRVFSTNMDIIDAALGGDLTVTGDLVIDGPGRRITGDFNNAAHASRTLFVHGAGGASANTLVGALPAAGGLEGAWVGYNGPDPDAAGRVQVGANVSYAYLQTVATGAAAIPPLRLLVQGGAQAALHPSGGIGLLSLADPGAGTVQVAGDLSVDGDLTVTGLVNPVETGQLVLPTRGPTGGVLLAGDTNLYSPSANVLQTDDALVVLPLGSAAAPTVKIGTRATGLSASEAANNYSLALDVNGTYKININEYNASFDTQVVFGPTVLSVLPAVGNTAILGNTAQRWASVRAEKFFLGTGAAFGLHYGAGAPSFAAETGSLYLRTDGSSSSTRAYINTNGSTGWTAITTAA